MKKENLFWTKNDLRQALLMKRAALTQERRQRASQDAAKHLMQEYQTGFVLSFASLPDEIDLWHFNLHLAGQGRLVLPKVNGDELTLHLVSNLATDLEFSSWKILEPLEHCPRVSLHEITCCLVPGLGFDSSYARIGYGKGYYDRLLQQSPILKIGVGFKEQLLEQLLPLEPHDQRLDKLLLL